VPELGACKAAGDPGCRVVYAADMTAVNDGVRDDSSLHGTNVASIAASVAPRSRIIALVGGRVAALARFAVQGLWM
jgi:hypothetical protein